MGIAKQAGNRAPSEQDGAPIPTRGGHAAKTARFARKRSAVIDAATRVMNSRGVRGMTFVEVAEAVDLSTSSITYYFRFKEQLAAAAFTETLRRIEALVESAAQAPTPSARVDAYVSQYFDLLRNIEQGHERPIAILSDMRALDDSVRIPLAEQYSAIFRRIRAFFGEPASDQHRALNTARAQVLTESMYWLPMWLFTYAYGDFDRVRLRMLDLFEKGLAPHQSAWSPQLIEIDREGAAAKGQANFLRVATRLISERGYRGASVERIAAELNVTKGSFYHHLDAKDDLVLACFRHSYATIASVLKAEVDGAPWHRLSSMIATLLDIQLDGQWPLLRTTALQTLPADVRLQVVARSDRMALRLAGIIADGISEGGIRPTDPIIASQAIMPSLNAAYELHNWAGRFGDRKRAVAVYASTLAYGLFDDRMI